MNGKKTMQRGVLVVGLLAAMLGLVPASAHTEAANDITLKVALMIPRTPEAATQAKRYNSRLAEMTDGSVKVRIYWGGAAGDDRDVLRKMRTGQMDGAPLSLELVSNIVRQCLVLASPALFNNYRELDAVRAALSPDFDKEAYENGFKVMGWGDVGRLRLFTKKPLTRIADFRGMRPWLYPESEMLKEFYKVVNATGVPLSIAEVYGGLQTNMIDVIWASALLAAALQWHTGTEYVSERGLGFIGGAFVFRRAAWDGLPKNVQESMTKLALEEAPKQQIDLRKSDERAYIKLVERGHKKLVPANIKEWWDTGHMLRKRLVGRIYTKELLERVEQIAAKYKEADEM
jgi:TRAP-type C4-dicarboxylate transport system substrate-binding protein